MSLKIIGLGKAIPKRQVTNDELATFIDTDDEWIVSRTGIKSRYVCAEESLTDLSVTATEQALERAGLTPQDMDLIVCATLGGDYRMPALACCIAERIGAKAPAFDLNAACTGFLYALETAAAFLDAGKATNVLIVCAEKMSTQVDWRDRSTCVLFGDGAAACVLTKGETLKYIHLKLKEGVSALCLPSDDGNSPFVTDKKEQGFLHMQGQEVFKFAVGAIANEIKQALATLQITADDVDYFLLHQANKRIIDSARAKVRQPEEKFPMNIDRYGNISCVSILLLLCEMVEEGKIQAGQTIFMAAFGAGLTVGSCVLEW